MDQTPYNVNVNVNTQPQQAAQAAQQTYQQQPVYQQPIYQAPAKQLPTDRNLAVVILLSIITLGIYALVFQYQLIKEINLTAASDGKKTTGLFVMILLSLVTFGIYGIVWQVMFIQRVENENKRRNTGVQFGLMDWVIFNLLLSFTIVCPLIFMSRQIKAFNAINTSYNIYG